MGKRLSIWICLLVLSGMPPTFALPFSVTYSKLTAAGVRLNVVVVDLDDPNVAVVPAMAKGFNASTGTWAHEPFVKFIRRLQPTAAINGTFFSKTDWKPVGSVMIDGKLVNNGDLGTAFCLDPTNKPFFLPSARQQGSRIPWGAARHALTCGPTLVWEGRVDVRPEVEGFSDAHVLGGGARSALGVTASRQLLLVTTSGGATLTQLAQAMKSLGAEYAINLDGGASQALYFRGNVISAPERELTNVLLVYENKWRVPWHEVKQMPVDRQQVANPSGGGAEAHVAQGRKLALEGKWQEAINEFLLAAKLEPNSAAIQRALGEAYEKLGLIEEAVRVYRQTAEIYQQKGYADYAQALLQKVQTLLAQLQPPPPPQPSEPERKEESKGQRVTEGTQKEKTESDKAHRSPPQPTFLERARLRIQPYLAHINWMGIITGVILFIGMNIGFALGGMRAGMAVLSLFGSLLVGIAGSPRLAAAAQGKVQVDADALHFYSFLALTALTWLVLWAATRPLRQKQHQQDPYRIRRRGKRTYPWVGALCGLGGTWLLMGTVLWFLSTRSEAHSRVRTDIENSRLATYVRDTTLKIG
ncbi:MAG: phosphodiester glycosidase family protein, partial [Abditibacteriales bacterium]|nr:phosphodiester glycosidase family protein [Abditibacteriales bacterium]